MESLARSPGLEEAVGLINNQITIVRSLADIKEHPLCASTLPGKDPAPSLKVLTVQRRCRHGDSGRGPKKESGSASKRCRQRGCPSIGSQTSGVDGVGTTVGGFQHEKPGLQITSSKTTLIKQLTLMR